MDTTALQSTIDTLTAQQTTLTQELEDTKNQLANANVINALEALTPDQLAALNAALAADPQNTNNIVVAASFPTQGA